MSLTPEKFGRAVILPDEPCPICVPVLPQTVTIDLAHQFLSHVAETLTRKNAAYGDSAANPVGVFSDPDPEAGIRVRIDDKLKRLRSLRQQPSLESSTPEEDTLLDLVGYLALLVAVREQKKPSAKLQESQAAFDALRNANAKEG